MYIHWRPLLEFGFLFWLLLCTTDLLGEPRFQKNPEGLHGFFDSPIMQEMVNKKVQLHVNEIKKSKSLKFGWSLLVWNSVTFIFSISFCFLAQLVTECVYKLYSFHKKKYMEFKGSKLTTPIDKTSVSKIPVLMTKLSACTKISDTSLKSKSCTDPEPNTPKTENDLKTSNSTESKINHKLPTCEMIFKNDRFSSIDLNHPSIRNWQNHCAKLREEMLKTQESSLKEHANLSRKLEAVSKEKKELSKQLALAQKENRAAKEQLKELLEEKSLLLKRLENATKEFKLSTSTKKVALARLDEVTENVEKLQLQLEQVYRDKEILESKFKLLEDEYTKVQERLRVTESDFITFDNLPERDDNPKVGLKNVTEKQYKEVERAANDCNSLSSSIPDAELDMKQIKDKIKLLEKSLETFSPSKLECSNLSINASLESDLSSSVLGHSDSQYRTDDYSETTEQDSPRIRSWTGKVGDMVHSIASKVNEKVRLLENIREYTEPCDRAVFSSTKSDSAGPRRIVSNSKAFKNFLEGLRASESSKTLYGRGRGPLF